MKHICSVATVQFAPVFDEIAQNFQQIESLIKDLDDDIVILPELCTTSQTDRRMQTDSCVFISLALP